MYLCRLKCPKRASLSYEEREKRQLYVPHSCPCASCDFYDGHTNDYQYAVDEHVQSRRHLFRGQHQHAECGSGRRFLCSNGCDSGDWFLLWSWCGQLCFATVGRQTYGRGTEDGSHGLCAEFSYRSPHRHSGSCVPHSALPSDGFYAHHSSLYRALSGHYPARCSFCDHLAYAE